MELADVVEDVEVLEEAGVLPYAAAVKARAVTAAPISPRRKTVGLVVMYMWSPSYESIRRCRRGVIVTPPAHGRQGPTTHLVSETK